MEIVYINTIEDVKNYGDVSIAHGFFDGVHIAHQQLIKYAKSYALKHNVKTGIVTFDKKVDREELNRSKYISSLTISTIKRREQLFKYYGVDIVFVINFENFKNISAQEYIDLIIKKIGTVNFVMGIDNKFGHYGKGSSENIRELSNNSFNVEVVDLIKESGCKISSSEIKKYIMEDDIEISNKLLGYYYQIHGEVIDGKKIGRTIGFPTANLKISDMVIIPKISVYATIIKIDDKFYKSMTNVGFNPTVDFRDVLNVETHIFDFDEDIYGKEVYLYFVAKVRDEKKFSTVDKLLEQLNIDKKNVKDILSTVDLEKII